MIEKINTFEINKDSDKPEKPLNEESGKDLERIVIGETSFDSESEEMIKNYGLLESAFQNMIDLEADESFEESSSENTELYTREEVSDLFKYAVRNPLNLKKLMSDLQEQSSRLGREIEDIRDRANNGVKFSQGYLEDFLKKQKIVRKRLSLLEGLKNKSKNLFPFKKIENTISKIQESEPVWTLYSRTLINSARSKIESKGIEVIKLQYVTTLIDDHNYMTWPDFFGADAFVDCEVVIDGKVRKSRIFIDGTKNENKYIDGGMGGSGRKDGKLIVPFSNLKDKPDMQTLGFQTATYIADKISSIGEEIR